MSLYHSLKDGIGSTTDIELEQEPFLSSGNAKAVQDPDDNQYSKPPSALHLTLYLLGILLLSLSSLTCLHILLNPRPPSMSPAKIFPELVYTPVDPLIGYKLVRFHTGFFDDEEPSVFDGPSTDAMDEAWTDLYDIWTYAISTLTEDENRRLADPTVAAFGNKSRLFGGLDVFHQLHCLDYVRKALEPERYGNPHGRRFPGLPYDKRKATTDLPHVSEHEHVHHCIDMVRQSLMCSADISVISWYMPEASSSEHTARPLPRFDQTRMCRDFDKLRDWARTRTPSMEALEGVMPHPHGH